MKLNKNMKRFHWNEETLQYFKNIEFNERLNLMMNFVKNECDLEDNETFEELIENLLYQINNTTIEEIESQK